MLPFLLPFVHPAEGGQRARAQSRHLADPLEQSLGAVQHTRAQVILREREQRLFAMLGGEGRAIQQGLVNSDRALHLAAPAVQGAQRKMRFDRFRVGVHDLQEHVERPVGLLVDEVVEAGEVIRMQLGLHLQPALAPAEVSGQYPDDEGRYSDGPRQRGNFGHSA